MKKILCILIIAFIFSCGKDDDSNNDSDSVLDPNAVLSVNMASNTTKSRAYSKEDSARLKEVIKSAVAIFFYDFDYQHEVIRGIYDSFKDTINLKIKFWGIDVIWPPSEGGVFTDFKPIPARLSYLSSSSVNVIFKNFKDGENDTIAYIPNKIIKSIHKRIKTAFNEENFTECYQIFDNEYVAYPCTGEQYRKLVADGIEKPYVKGMDVQKWYDEE